MAIAGLCKSYIGALSAYRVREAKRCPVRAGGCFFRRGDFVALDVSFEPPMRPPAPELPC